jgi:hypothetical protein
VAAWLCPSSVINGLSNVCENENQFSGHQAVINDRLKMAKAKAIMLAKADLNGSWRCLKAAISVKWRINEISASIIK